MGMFWGFDSRVVYTSLVAAAAAGRLFELRIAAGNRLRLLARGGIEASAEHYRFMVLLHTLFLIACPVEVWLLERPFIPALAAAMLVLFLLAGALRWWVIRTLDGRWTTRIVVLPGAPPVTGGPYRWIRHPNYVAVCAEIASLPLLHTAWVTAVVFSVLNAILLRVRIRAEERALTAATSYGEVFASTPRWIPGAR